MVLRSVGTLLKMDKYTFGNGLMHFWKWKGFSQTFFCISFYHCWDVGLKDKLNEFILNLHFIGIGFTMGLVIRWDRYS